MLWSGLSHTSSLCAHKSTASYGDSQLWSRSRSRTNSGFPSPLACSVPTAGKRASKRTDEEEETGAQEASSPLAIFSPLTVKLRVTDSVRRPGGRLMKALWTDLTGSSGVTCFFVYVSSCPLLTSSGRMCLCIRRSKFCAIAFWFTFIIYMLSNDTYYNNLTHFIKYIHSYVSVFNYSLRSFLVGYRLK